MIEIINFLNHLSDIAMFSYVILDKSEGRITHQKNLTNYQLTDKQIQRMLTQTSIIHNYYVKEKKLLLLAYDIGKLNQLVCLWIDDELGNFISYNDRLLKVAETIHLFVMAKEFTKTEIQSINQNILYDRGFQICVANSCDYGSCRDREFSVAKKRDIKGGFKESP